ncbi:MAG: ABC transporter ATP-binding protein [Lachnospiraceae bacterium]|nr:ABC transporter ATP-binding protein [Lachnospiraceae bacterium]
MLPIIEFKNFTFQYRAQKKPTLVDINLRIYKGEKILIAGPSGSGKSTLGSCLNGLIPFNNPGKITGELIISGKTPESVFDLSKIIGTVLQDTDGQFVGLSSGEDIAFLLENLARPQDEMKERVQAAAKLVGADGYLSHSPQRLSGGQKQRVSMAGVLIDDAPILLFDEPLAALDPLTGKLATALIDDIAKRTGATIIIIEHRLEDVLWKHIDRVILFDSGRIAADTTPDEITVSEKLTKAGIRRPLYINALERAGVVKLPADKPGRLETLYLADNDKEKVRAFAENMNDELKPAGTLSDSPLLDIKDVGFIYPETELKALENINFSLYSGEMTAIVGANGAGKSTLAKLIVGFEETGSGAIFYRGEDMHDLTIPERAERIGYVMQNPNQMICKPLIFDEIALGLRVRGVPEPEIKDRVEAVLKICGLERFIKWPVSALSYGQKKRVTIADALVLEPQILILDEPTAGQDYRHYTEIMEFLAGLNRRGVTVLLITHDMHLCLEYAKRALVFSEGRLLADCPTYEILSDPGLAAKASLRETSLYELAHICGVSDARKLVSAYLDAPSCLACKEGKNNSKLH